MRLPRVMIAAIAALLAVGTARAETIGFAQVGFESDWRTAFSADMKAEAARRGITLLYENADNELRRQREAVRGFVRELRALGADGERILSGNVGLLLKEPPAPERTKIEERML